MAKKKKKKSREKFQEQKTLISAIAYFLTPIAKNSF